MLNDSHKNQSHVDLWHWDQQHLLLSSLLFLDKVILYVFELLMQSCNWKYIFDHRLLWTTQRNNSFLLALRDSLHSQDSQHRSKRGRRWPWPTESNRFNACASIFNFNSPKIVQEKWETEVSGLNRWRNKWSKAPAATAVSGRATLKAAYRYSHGFNAAPEHFHPNIQSSVCSRLPLTLRHRGWNCLRFPVTSQTMWPVEGRRPQASNPLLPFGKWIHWLVFLPGDTRN